MEKSSKVVRSSDAKTKTFAKSSRPRSKATRKGKRKLSRKRSKYSESSGENQQEAMSSRQLVSTTGRRKKAVAKNSTLNPSESDNCSASRIGPIVSSESKLPSVLATKPKRPRKQYLCSQCGRQMKSKSSLDIHVRTHTGDRPFVCQICGREFRANGNLTRHQVSSSDILVLKIY